jgi:hypothetical protein
MSQEQPLEKRNNQTPSSSSISHNIMSSFYEFQDIYSSFSLNKEISFYREQLNAKLHKKAFFQDVYRIASHPKTWKHVLDSQLFLYSSTLNEKYPYFASLCHTQHPTLMTGMTLLTFIPLRSKGLIFVSLFSLYFLFFVSAGWTKRSSISLLGLSLLLSGSVISTFNYKWNYPLISESSISSSLPSPLERVGHNKSPNSNDNDK